MTWEIWKLFVHFVLECYHSKEKKHLKLFNKTRNYQPFGYRPNFLQLLFYLNINVQAAMRQNENLTNINVFFWAIQCDKIYLPKFNVTKTLVPFWC